MRLCSRSAGVAVSEAFGGSGRLACVTLRRPKSAQLASGNAKSAGAISRHATMSLCAKSPFTAPPLIPQNLDLLGTARLHPGAAPLLDPSANSHAPPAQGFRR